MNMRIREFLVSEEGAVTVDWVVLTAGLVTMSLLVISMIREEMPAALGRVLEKATVESTQ